MLCYNCFKENKNEGKPCPHCGYDGRGDAEKYPQALPAGTILNGQYTVGRVLGQGGFGITYIAQEYKTKELVAIKEYLPAEFSTRGSGTRKLTVFTGDRAENFEYGKEKFLEEAKTLAQFRDNINICRVDRYFEENGTAYIAMEYIDGTSLDKYMARHGGRLTIDEARRLLTPVMDALIYVHSKGVIHRDIAPDNIIITKDGTVKLIDFGAARYSMGEKTRSLDVVLKHGFAPVEQYSRHGRQGAYTDVYALAATWYYALTGRIPPDSIDRRDEDTISDPSTLGVRMTADEEDALLKALSVMAADRYQNVADMKAAFDPAVKPDPLPQPEPEPIPAPIPNPEPAPTPIPIPNPKPEPEPKPSVFKKLFVGIAAAIVAFLVILISVIIPNSNYNAALKLYNNGKYEEAITAFKALNGYKDSKVQIENCKTAIKDESYNAAEALYKSGKYKEALAAFEQLDGYKDSEKRISGCRLGMLEIGDTLTFGKYEQDNDTSNGKEDIEWLVLDKDGANILVISKYALDCRQYNTSYTDVTWESCTLRKWLNGTFLNEAFSTEETAMIATTTVTADKNPNYSTSAGNDTQDKVFLLSITEAEKFFPSDDYRMCVPTAYAIAQGAYTSSNYSVDGEATCWWWLRSPGYISYYAAFVYIDGSVICYGNFVYDVDDCVRPALWINPDS